MTPPRGAFILFEGVDRCGKTTQTQKLVESLAAKGHNVELWRFPDRTTEIGKMINAYLANSAELDDAAVHLLFSANRWEKHKGLEARLAEGVTLVVDRYAYSGVAFTAAKGLAGLGLEWCKAPDAGLPAPDAVIFLDMEPKAAAARGGFGEERYEKLDFQKVVRETFMKLRGDSWHIVDAARTIEAVSADVEVIAAAAMEAAGKGKPLGRLWG